MLKDEISGQTLLVLKINQLIIFAKQLPPRLSNGRFLRVTICSLASPLRKNIGCTKNMQPCSGLTQLDNQMGSRHFPKVGIQPGQQQLPLGYDSFFRQPSEKQQRWYQQYVAQIHCILVVGSFTSNLHERAHWTQHDPLILKDSPQFQLTYQIRGWVRVVVAVEGTQNPY